MDRTCLILLILTQMSWLSTQEKILKKVIIISRHNLREPFTEDLEAITPKPWPKWSGESGHLTAKGEKLERYMGEYFGAWLRKHRVLTEQCPNENEFFAYANIIQRTRNSGKAFVEKAFPNCNVSVHVSPKKVDLYFSTEVHNNTEAFKEMAMKEMSEKLKEVQLHINYTFLEEFIDYKSSKKCVEESLCDLKNDKNTLYVNYTHQPDIFGPLKIAKTIGDAILIEYYDGNEVAWGQTLTEKQLKDLVSFLISYHQVKFNSTLLSKDISQPIIKYMKDIWQLEDDMRKVTLLIGHESNIITILLALNFKHSILPKQLEVTPIGGRIVFQKWFDNVTNQDYLKIDYVYQSTEQIKEAKRLSLDDPPQWFTMGMNDCNINSEGFCKWKDFEAILNKHEFTMTSLNALTPTYVEA